MKKISVLGILMMALLLTGCENAEQKAQLVTCQQEKQQLQSQVDQANATIQQKDQQIDKLKGDVREVNQKALESIRTMMEKQNAKDVELKNKLKDKEAEVKTLQQQVNELKAKDAQIEMLKKQISELKEKAAQIEELQQKLNKLQAQQADTDAPAEPGNM